MKKRPPGRWKKIKRLVLPSDRQDDPYTPAKGESKYGTLFTFIVDGVGNFRWQSRSARENWIEAALTASKCGDSAAALGWLKLASMIDPTSFALQHNRGRKFGAKQKVDPDREAVAFVVAKAQERPVIEVSEAKHFARNDRGSRKFPEAHAGSLYKFAAEAVDAGLAPVAESTEALKSAKERIVRKAKAELSRRHQY